MGIDSNSGLDRRIYAFFKKHSVTWLKMVGLTTVVGAETVDVLTRNQAGDILSCSGLVKPTDATDGYAKGCTFIKTDAAAGAKSIYENTGTKDSCVFNLAGEEVPGDLVLAQGSILRGSATGYSEAVVHSAAGKVLIGNGTDPVSTSLVEDIKSISAGGSVYLNDRFREKVVTIDATAGVNTWTAAELLGGILRRDCNGGDRADLMPTGALLVAGINSGDPVGTFVDFTITNNGAANTITMAAGGVLGVTFLPASVTLGPGNSKRFIAVITGAAAYTVYCVGSNAGLIFDADVDPAADITSTKIDFDHGITMAGALAVGIELTGTYTDGIDLSAATLTQASDNALFSIGSYGTAKVVALTSAAFYTPFQINLLSSANPSGGETIMAGGYIKVATNTIDQPAMNSVALNLRNTIGMSLVSAYGLQSHMTFVTTAELDGAGTASPISGKITLGHANTSGVIAVGYFTLDGAFAPAAPTYGVWIDIVDATATAGLIIASSGTGKMSKGISLSSAVMAEGTDNALFCIGSYSSAKSVTLATNAFYVPFHINILSTANPAGGETIMSGTYVKAATTGNQADMNLVGETVRVTVGGNVAQAYGVQCHLTVSGACVAGTNANVCAGSFKTVVNAAMTATVNVMLLTYENATATVIAGEKNILTLDPTAAVTNYFMLYNTANATNLFEFQAAAACAAGASKNGASTGSIKIVIGGTSYYIPYYV